MIQGRAIPLPSWLTSDWLTTQQDGIQIRTQELGQFFAMVLNSMAASDSVETLQKESMQRAMDQTILANTKMTQASTALSIADWSTAERRQAEALRALLLAWENFADLKTLIEWTHRDNEIMRSLLEQSEQIQEQLPTAEEQEAEFVRLLEQNQVRLQRLEPLLATEQANALQQLQQSDNASSNTEESTEQIEDLYQQAQDNRASALESLERISQGTLSTELSLQEIQLVHDNLRLLRMMFFTVIEHLQDAAEQQEKLWQQTGTDGTKPYEEFLQDAPLRMLEQSQLNQRTEMISKELQSMADEMAVQGNTQQSESLGDAFVETGLAHGFMKDAVMGLSDMVSQPTMSFDVAEVVEDQQQALEALLRAIQALQPPQQGEQEEDDGEQEQNEQQDSSQGEAQNQPNEMSQREAQRKMQAAKEKEV